VIEMKRCPKCGRDTDEFAKNKTRKDGLQRVCKSCHRGYTKKHYADNTQYYKDKAKRRRDEMKPILRAIVSENKQNPCKDCGEQFPECAMDFHHPKGDLDKKVIGELVNGGYSAERLLEEIRKCTLLCACCHRIRHHG
jgi:hypothetical protein